MSAKFPSGRGAGPFLARSLIGLMSDLLDEEKNSKVGNSPVLNITASVF